MRSAARFSSPWLVIFVFALTVQGQDISKVYAVQCNVGVSLFRNGGLTHGVAGCSVKVPLTNRWAFQPEVQMVWAGRGRVDVVLKPAGFSVDFKQSPSDVRPYVVFGYGAIVTWERSVNTVWSQYSDVGGGLKFFVDDRRYVGPELRNGYGAGSLRWSVTVAGGQELK